ncbi:MAG TPA: hypothetical protein VHL98_13840 [Microvirga sp.]|jgi:hypothetical protein|nr:hypothetical protein [Microvirga sp.]
MSDDDSLANSSLSTSRVPPQDGQKPDSLPTTRTLPGNDHQKGLEKTGSSGATRGAGGRAGIESPGKRNR